VLLARSSSGDFAGSCRSWVGSAQYIAPEIVQGKAYQTEVDVWSLGIMAQELATNSRCYDETSHILVEIRRYKVRPMSCNVHPALSGLISRMLSRDVQVRKSMLENLVVDVI